MNLIVESAHLECCLFLYVFVLDTACLAASKSESTHFHLSCSVYLLLLSSCSLGVLSLCMSCTLEPLKTGLMVQDFSENHLLFLFNLIKELHC